MVIIGEIVWAVVLVLVEQMLHRREILTADGESLQAELFMIRKVSVSRTQWIYHCFMRDACLIPI